MNNISIKKMEIENFRGIKKLSFEPKKINKIMGINASGKTTIFHAFSWLLTERNTEGKKEFLITPVDENGNVIFGKFPSVSVDFGDFGFRKVMDEKWTKGSKDKPSEFKGYSIKYFVTEKGTENPVSKSEYNSKLEELIGDNYKIEMLSSIDYFAKILHWTERRNILFELAEDIDKVEEEITSSSKEFEIFSDIADKETYRKELKRKLSDTEKEISDTKIRLDENTRRLKEVEEEEISFDPTLPEKLTSMELKKEEINKEYLEKYDKFIEETEKKKKLKLELVTKSASGDSDKFKKFKDAEKKVISLKTDIKKLKDSVSGFSGVDDKIETLENEIKNLVKQKEQKTEEYKSWKDKKEPDEKICSKCGQNIPAKNFEEDKKAAMDQIVKLGKELSLKIEQRKKEKIELEEQKETIEREIKDLSLKLEIAEADEISTKEDFQATTGDEATKKEIEKIDDLLSRMNEKIEKYKSDKNDKIVKIDSDMKILSEKIRKQNSVSEDKSRIEELYKKHEELGNLKLSLEEKIRLLDSFISKKCSVIEEKVNSMFKITKFKLFNNLINGELELTCEAMVDGVPFTELNTGSKILAGLDILNVVNKFYNISIPVFIDNFESLTEEIPEIESQLFVLEANQKTKKLTILSENSTKALKE